MASRGDVGVEECRSQQRPWSRALSPPSEPNSQWGVGVSKQFAVQLQTAGQQDESAKGVAASHLYCLTLVVQQRLNALSALD